MLQAPKPLLLQQKEVDALYDALSSTLHCLSSLSRPIRYSLCAGTLLGAVRSASLLFCDDDNWFCPSYVERVHQILESHPEVALVGGWGEPAQQRRVELHARAEPVVINGRRESL